MDLDERANRCRVMWEKARNMYASFFTELSEVMTTMPAADFDDWCFKSVGVSLNVAIKASEILKATDAARVQSELKAAARVAKESAKQEIFDIRAKQIETQLTIEKNRTAIREQKAINSLLKYEPKSTLVASVLRELASRQAQTRIENGLAYMLLKEAVKRGAEGNDPTTGKKWKWEKWAELAIRRPLPTIREAMRLAKQEASKNDGYPSFSNNALNGNHNFPAVDNIYHRGAP